MGGGARPARTAWGIERLAPAFVFGSVLLVAGVAIWLGTRSALPPATVPSGGGSPNAAALPEGHPPVGVPDDVRKVLERMAESAKAKPDDVELWKQLGFAQYRAGQVEPSYLDDAAKTYEHVLELRPEDPDALRALGNVAYDHEAPQQATEYYKRYLEQRPDDAFVLTDLGTMYLALQRVDEAIQTYQEVLAADPAFFQAKFNLAIAYRAAGDSDKAVEAMREARDVAPDDATRKRVEELLAHVAGAPAAAAAEGAPSGLQADVEAIFRSHPIVGPKLDRIDWEGDRVVRVVLRDFPMDGMPPMVRQRFTDRIRTGLQESKAKHGTSDEMRVELVDAATGRVMETVAE